MRIYERPGSPYWWLDVTIQGERIRKSLGVPVGRKTLQVARDAAMREIEAHKKRLHDIEMHGHHSEITIGDAMSRWLSESGHLADQVNMRSRVAKLLGRSGRNVWHLDPNRPLHSLTDRDITALRTARLKEGCSHGTANREIALLSAVYNRARTKWAVKVHPNVHFEMVRVHHKTRYLTVEEENDLLSELDPAKRVPNGLSPLMRLKLQDQYDLCVALLDTGARYSEIAELPWIAVDTAHWRYVSVYRTKVQNEGVLPMTARLREVLQRRWENARTEYVFPAYEADGHGVVIDKARGHATKGIMKAMERAGINTPVKVQRYGKATVHSLRDTYASRLAQAGVSLYKISKLLGHSDIKMAAKYAHLAPSDMLDEVSGVLDGYHGRDAARRPEGPRSTSGTLGLSACVGPKGTGNKLSMGDLFAIEFTRTAALGGEAEDKP